MFSPFLEKNPVVNLLHLGHRKPAARQARGAEFGLEQNLKKKALVPQGLDSVLGQSNPLWQAGWPKISSKLI